MGLEKDYSLYVERIAEYRKRRKELLEEPEKELKKISDNLEVFELRGKVEKALIEQTKIGEKLYHKIYDGVPTVGCLTRFINVATRIINCPDLLYKEDLAKWNAAKSLIENYKITFKEK